MNKRVPLAQKLVVLQEVDTWRKWYSLDDRRVCVGCDRMITGRQIDIWEDKAGTFHLHCPTPGCTATPHEWFYHGLTRPPAAEASARRESALHFFGPAYSRGTG